MPQLTKSEKLRRLEDAIDSGALSVKYADEQVTYRSLSEMRSIRDQLRRELGVSDRRPNCSLASFGRD